MFGGRRKAYRFPTIVAAPFRKCGVAGNVNPRAVSVSRRETAMPDRRKNRRRQGVEGCLE